MIPMCVEIVTAPFVVAQLQLYLLLSRMGAEEAHRPAVFLTNALTAGMARIN